MMYSASQFKPAITSGFSLVETLVAISLLLIVISGPMTITARSAKSTSFATEQVQAFFLAQEGVELVQKLRDDLLLANRFELDNDQAWTVFTNLVAEPPDNPCRTGNAGCGLHWSDNTNVVDPIACAGTTCRLYYRTTNDRSRFTHTSVGTEPTLFTRRIYFTHNGDMMLVRSVVTWRTGSLISEQRVEVQTYLYNIYPNP